MLHLQLENKGKEYVIISVIDNGHGIKQENLPRVTEAFYTTKQDKIGLGLTVANRIVAEHLGELHISSERDTGTRIDIILPRKCGNTEIQEARSYHMNKGYIFKNEEIKALKVFLSLFLLFFVYDLAYEFIVPLIAGEQEGVGKFEDGLGLWLYF